jgi:DNA repair exonuclease SbcCD ATPase subunit
MYDQVTADAIKENAELRERIRVLEGEVTRLKTVPIKYRRMEFNAQLQNENTTLNERVRVLREALQRADEVLEDMGCNQTSAACRAALEATK